MMNEYGISDKSYSIILNTIKSFKEIEKVVIFGESLKRETALNLSSELNEMQPIPYYVDVLAPRYIRNLELLHHIDRIGKEIYLCNQ